MSYPNAFEGWATIESPPADGRFAPASGADQGPTRLNAPVQPKAAPPKTPASDVLADAHALAQRAHAYHFRKNPDAFAAAVNAALPRLVALPRAQAIGELSSINQRVADQLTTRGYSGRGGWNLSTI